MKNFNSLSLGEGYDNSGATNWDILTEPDNSDEAISYRLNRDIFSEGFNFRDMNYEQFENVLIGVNNIVRGEGSDISSFDSTGTASIGEFYGLKPEHVESAMKLVFETCKELPNNEAAALMYYTINKAHAFNDGNGRTSRVISSSMLDKGGPIDFSSDIGHDGNVGKRSKNNRKDRHRVNYRIWDYMAEYFLNKYIFKVDNDNGVDKFAATYTDTLRDDSSLSTRNVSALYFEEDFNKGLYLHDKGIWSVKDNGYYMVDRDELDYSRQDIERIEDFQSGIKLARIDIVADLFRNPDKHEPMSDGSSVKDYLMRNSVFM